MQIRSILGNIGALVAGGLVLFMEVWTVLPAPSSFTLAAAVVVPEITPWAIAVCILAGTIGQFAACGWARSAGVLFSAFAFGCALVPWLLLPSTIERCEHEMRAALGATYPAGLPALQRTLTSGRPYNLGIALAGYRAPGSIRVRRDLLVHTRDGARLALDVYGPVTTGPRPTVIIIYGGAWIFGSRADSAQLARSFAALGYTAIAIDYRHAPTYRFPVQINDVRDAIATIARNAGAWDVDPSRVALFGRSAGAQLALLAAYAPEPLTIRTAVAYYAPTDLVQGYRIPPRPDPADVDGILRAYIGGTPDDRLDAYLSASPVTHVHAGLPPTLLIGGGRDELVRLAFAHELRDALRLRGVHVAALDLPWSNHAFDSITNGTAAQIARYYTERFLALTL